MSPYEKIFSANIRKYRKQLGFTQKMLADATGYSEKTVSKWETDGCIPQIDSLIRIASVFRINLDTLFQEKEPMYFLGIDGGGTKTAFALADPTGTILRTLQLGPCNPFDIGIENSKNVLSNGIAQICDGIPLSSVVLFAGLAGGKAGTFADPLTAFFNEFRFAAFQIGSDNENIIAAGLYGRDGITMIMGTGVCSYVVKNNTYHRIAGWGYLFDEGGSAYNIGREALSSYFSSCDGSGKETSLSRRIEEMTGDSPSALLNNLYEGGKKVIASYARLVFEEAEKGDAVSLSILHRNMEEAARIIHAARAHFPDDAAVPVILAGGLTEQAPLLPMLKEALGNTENLHIEILSVPPVEGALQKARELWKEECQI